MIYGLRVSGFRAYVKSQAAQNNRLPYPKVAHKWLKVAPKYRLAFQERVYDLWFKGLGFRVYLNPKP